MTTVLRHEIVNAARGWVGTPYHHQARIKGIGVDCIGLVIGVARELDIVPQGFDVNGYSREPDGDKLLQSAGMHMTLIERKDMQVGDVVCVAFESNPRHFGVLADYRHGGFSIVHAAAHENRVIETRLMFTSAMRYCASFKLPGVI